MYRVITTTTTSEVNGETVTTQSTKEEIISEDVDIFDKLSANTGAAVKNGVTFRDELNLENENYPGRVVYTTTDKYGRESEDEFTYLIDKEDPTLVIVSPALGEDEASSITYLPQSAAMMSVSGTASDNIANSVSKIEYIIVDAGTDGTAEVPAKDADGWTSVIGLSGIEISYVIGSIGCCLPVAVFKKGVRVTSIVSSSLS